MKRFLWLIGISLLMVVAIDAVRRTSLRATRRAETESSRQAALLLAVRAEQARLIALESESRRQAAKKVFDPDATLVSDERSDRALQVAKVRAGLMGWAHLYYAPLGQKLGLSKDQMVALEKAAAELQYESNDLREAAGEQELPENSAEYGQLRRTLVAQARQEEVQIIGEANAMVLQDYDRTEAVRYTLAGVAGNTYETDPLTAAQSEAAMRALENLSATYLGGGPVIPDEINLTEAASRLSPILSANQIATLTRQIESWRATNEINLRARGVTGETTGNGG